MELRAAHPDRVEAGRLDFARFNILNEQRFCTCHRVNMPCVHCEYTIEEMQNSWIDSLSTAE